MKKITVKVLGGSKPLFRVHVFSIEANSFYTFKVEFLKRFGNITSASRKALAEKFKVKGIVYESQKLKEMVDRINVETSWTIEVQIDENP